MNAFGQSIMALLRRVASLGEPERQPPCRSPCKRCESIREARRLLRQLETGT